MTTILSEKTKKKRAPVEYLCILDFEATCDDKGPKPCPQEIIEFPTLLMNVSNGKIEDTFHHYIKPDVHPTLSDFCKKITGITQETVDSGISLERALELHEKWLNKHRLMNNGLISSEVTTAKRFLYVICGDWDLKRCLPDQLQHHGITMPPAFGNWINLHKAYVKFYRTKVKTIAEMLDNLNLDLEEHHSGVDDCKNLVRICSKMLEDGWTPVATTSKGIKFNSLERSINKPSQTKSIVQANQKDPTENRRDKTVYLIRHGQSVGNATNTFGGADRNTSDHLIDCGLTETGRNQALDIAKFFTDVTIDLVVSSPMTRALNTAVLGFPNYDILVHYNLREFGCRIPENVPRPMNEVLKDIHADVQAREKHEVTIDLTSLQPKRWPNPHSSISRKDEVRNAFQWLYTNRQEQTIVVVCHYNVIRSLLSDNLGRCSIKPKNGIPICCLLKADGNLVTVE